MGRDSNDGELVVLMRATKNGDADAYRMLLERLVPVIRDYLRSRFGSLPLLEDCVQESLLAVHRAKHTFETDRPFKPWLFALVRHHTVDVLRREQRNAHDQETEFAAVADEQAKSHTADHAMDAVRLLQWLEPKYRMPLMLTKWAGYSTAEAAQHLGIREHTLKVRVHRAIRQLRKHMADEE